jgi:acyl CoA:acetate/3-ketoacid CoA transferase beta subunit
MRGGKAYSARRGWKDPAKLVPQGVAAKLHSPVQLLPTGPTPKDKRNNGDSKNNNKTIIVIIIIIIIIITKE